MSNLKNKIIEKAYNFIFRSRDRESEWKTWESFKKKDMELNDVPREISCDSESKYYTWLVDEIQMSIGKYPHEILEIGGTGALSFYFTKLSLAIRCTLVDNSNVMLKYAKWLFGTQSLKVIKGDARNLPIKNDKYDLVCSSGLIEHFSDDDIERTLSEMRRVTKPNGYIFIAVPNFFSLDLMRIWLKFGKGSERHITIKDMVGLYIKKLFPNDKLIVSKHSSFVFGCNVLPAYIEKKLGRAGLGFLNYIIVQKYDKQR